MKIDGNCHCGFIKYEAEIDLNNVIICHCTDCQILSASAFRTVARVEDSSFNLLSGDPKIYIKIGGSGNKREQAFCPECGSALYATSVGDGPKVYSIRLGTATQRDQLVPKRQLWTSSALSWLPDLDSIPKVEKQ